MNEGGYYIFFSGKVSSPKHKLEGLICDGGTVSSYVYIRDPFNISYGEDYGKIEKICLDNYKWWKKNDKHFDTENYETH